MDDGNVNQPRRLVHKPVRKPPINKYYLERFGFEMEKRVCFRLPRNLFLPRI